MAKEGGDLPATTEAPAPALLEDLRSLIEAARLQVAVGVNAEMVLLYWRKGSRIRQDVRGAARASYGKRIVETVADQLTAAYGRGFSRPNLTRAVRFAEQFPEAGIVATLSHQLSWSFQQAEEIWRGAGAGIRNEGVGHGW